MTARSPSSPRRELTAMMVVTERPECVTAEVDARSLLRRKRCVGGMPVTWYGQLLWALAPVIHRVWQGAFQAAQPQGPLCSLACLEAALGLSPCGPAAARPEV